ncbi:DNA-binding transcriptional LysR family regulator [Nocardioides kongjuensis]|uniref:DNA-binding transcriptional LysR family regulator n=2 Tax=Nocardioides TaxID=1839 RepID=A0A852RRY5_9ACTN|nr:DNA-binding transcriptional LysR family regulator [Nocardioides kongjuensis]
MSSAARQLRLTQSAVSQQLRLLEREAGSPLLVRSTRGIDLTEAGVLLLRRADAISGELSMATEELASLANLHAGKVRLIAFPSAASSVVPVAIQRLRRRAPGIEVRFVEAEPPAAKAAIQAGEAEIAIVFDYDDVPADELALESESLGVESMFLVHSQESAPDDRPIAQEWLSEQDWIAGCQDCRQHLVERCRSAGFVPRVMHESDDYVVLQSLVAHGLGVAVLPRLALTTFRHPSVEARLAGDFGERTVSAVYRPGAEQVPATRALLEQLKAATSLALREPLRPGAPRAR